MGAFKQIEVQVHEIIFKSIGTVRAVTFEGFNFRCFRGLPETSKFNIFLYIHVCAWYHGNTATRKLKLQKLSFLGLIATCKSVNFAASKITARTVCILKYVQYMYMRM